MTIKPREFWMIYFKNGRCQVSEKLVTEFDEYFGPPNYEAELPKKVTHVIEYSAYEAVRNNNKEILDQRFDLMDKIARLEAALQMCKEQRDFHLQGDEAYKNYDEQKLREDTELDAILKPEQNATPGETKEQG